MSISDFTKFATGQQENKKKPSRFTQEMSSFLQPTEVSKPQTNLKDSFGVKKLISGATARLRSKQGQQDSRVSQSDTANTTPQIIGPGNRDAKITNVLGGIIQGTARSLAGGAAGLIGLTKPDSPSILNPRERLKSFVDAEVDPQSDFAQIATGRKEPFTLRQEGEETLAGFGAGEETSIKFGGIVGGLIPLIDWTPLGKGSRSITKISSEILGKRTADETVDVLIRQGVDENLARQEAEDLVKLSDDVALQERLADIFDTQNAIAAKRAGDVIARTSDTTEIQRALETAGIKRGEAKKLSTKLVDETDPVTIAREIAPDSVSRAEQKGLSPTTRASDDIPEELAAEARKYDSEATNFYARRESVSEAITNEDSFVKAHRLFHGANTQFADQLDQTKRFVPDAEREAGTGGNFYGLSATTDARMAQDFSTSATGEGRVVELFIDPKARVLNLKNRAIDDLSEAETRELSKTFDVIRDVDNIGGESEVRILNPNILRDESAIRSAFTLEETGITDIFNRVKGEGRVADEAIEGAPTAQQRQGTRVLTPEGRRFVETPEQQLQQSVEEQGYDSARDIEELVRVPVRTSEDTGTMQQVATAEGFETKPVTRGGLEVRNLAGQEKFDLATAKGIRKGDIEKPDYVASRIMNDESTRPAVRESGVYAEKDWETHNFRDVGGGFGGGLSFTLRDTFLALDNVTAREAGETGAWGPGAHLQYSVRQADGARDTFGANQGQRIRNILENRGLKANTQTGRQLNLALWGMRRGADDVGEAVDEVIARLDVTPAAAEKARPELIKAANKMSDEVFDAADEVRGVLDELREQANVVRKEMGKPTIGFVEDYGPLLQRQSFWQQMRQSTKTTITDNFDFVIPNAKRNPHAIPRKGGMDSFETNALDTLERYIDNISNDIFIAPQIEKLKAVKEVLKGRGYNGASRMIDRFIRENLAGQPGIIDAIIGLRKGTKTSNFISRTIQARSIFALAGNPVWTAFVQPASAATLTIPRSGGLTHGMQNFLGGLYDIVTSKRMRRMASKQPTMVSKTKGASVGMTGAGDMGKLASKIQKGKMETYNDFVGKFSDANEYWLTSSAMGAGYREARRLGLKGRDADIYADWMGGATQSEYTQLARPLFLNNSVVRLAAPFQTFAFEFWRYAKTLAGAPGGMPLEKSQRLNQAVMLMAGIYVYNQYTEATIGRTLTTPGSVVPIIGGFVDDRINDLKELAGFSTEDNQGGLGRSPVAPAEDIKTILSAIESFRENGDVQPLRKELVKWGMGYSGLSGASAVNRFVDGMIANVTGMQTTRSGEFAFPVNGSDKLIAPIMGPWSTSAGKQYLNERAESERVKSDVQPIFNQVQELVAAGKDEQAQAVVDSLRGEEWEAYKSIRAVERRRRTEELKVEMQPVYQEAKELVEQGRDDEAQQLVDNLSEEEWKAYELIKEQNKKFEQAEAGEKPIWGDGEVDDTSNIIEIVRVYAEAVFKGDVESAFQALFTDEKIRKVEGDAVIFQRAPFRETQRMREERANELDINNLDEMRLDHTVPLQLGGDNSSNNLQLVPEQIHRSYTPIENHLGRLLRNGDIKEKEAQQLIKDFKEGRTTAQQIYDLTDEG